MTWGGDGVGTGWGWGGQPCGFETKPQLWTLRQLEPEVILQSSAFWLLRDIFQKAKSKVRLKHSAIPLNEKV